MNLHELNNDLPQLSPNIQTSEKITLPKGVDCELLFNGANGVYNLKYIWKLAKRFGFTGDWDDEESIECSIEAEDWLNANICQGCQIECNDDVWIVRNGYDFENGCEYDTEEEETTQIEEIWLPTWSLPYLINGDLEGITEEELKKCKEVENVFEIISTPSGDWDSSFRGSNYIDNLGADCVLCPCIRRKETPNA